MTYGETRRAKQRINVLRGYGGNEPVSLTRLAKPKLNEGILSGMLISLDVNGEWIKGVPAGKVPFFAWHDQTDTDVTSSGKLLGLSGAGKYELQTAYIKSGDTFAEGTPIIAGTAGEAGNIAAGTLSGGADIIGFGSRGGRSDSALTNSEGGTLAGPNYVVTLITQWQPIHT